MALAVWGKRCILYAVSSLNVTWSQFGKSLHVFGDVTLEQRLVREFQEGYKERTCKNLKISTTAYRIPLPLQMEV